MTKCPKCGLQKDPMRDFYQSTRGRCGYCKKCSVRAASAYRKNAQSEKKKEYNRRSWLQKVQSGYTKTQKFKRCQKNNRLRSEYGITIGEYEMMVALRKGLCDICGKKPLNNLCVDHNHDTHENRGLLCHACNLMIGNSGDNPTMLLAGMRYLEKWTPIKAS